MKTHLLSPRIERLENDFRDYMDSNKKLLLEEDRARKEACSRLERVIDTKEGETNQLKIDLKKAYSKSSEAQSKLMSMSLTKDTMSKTISKLRIWKWNAEKTMGEQNE